MKTLYDSQCLMGMESSMASSMASNKSGISRQREHETTEHETFLRKKPKYTLQDEAVGASEIASAFALASLASMSQDSMLFETRDVENDVANEDSITDELRVSVKEEPAFVDFDERHAQILGRTSSGGKSVSFAPGTVHFERHHRRMHAFRRVSRDPLLRQSIPPSYQMRQAAEAPSQHQLPPPWIRQQSSLPAGFMPPYIMPRAPPSNQWICDFCNMASFATYDEACSHEQTCRARCGSAHLGAAWSQPNDIRQHIGFLSTTHTEQANIHQRLPSAANRAWFTGSTELALPESDPDYISELNCFIRSRCVEVFSATEEHVNRSSKRGPISLYQVGVRCRFCVHRACEDKALAAVSFPVSTAGIFESVKRWQRVHLEVCADMPTEMKKTIRALESANAWAPSTRQYWIESAKALGMVDTQEGIRFAADPRFVRRLDPIRAEPVAAQVLSSMTPHLQVVSSSTPATLSDGDPIVQANDGSLVPSYVYFLMSQVVRCRFTEADRFVARSKGPVGYPGFQCRHCNGHAGLGKYFPVTCKSLSTNSTSQNIHAHLLKCCKCPTELKQQLVALKDAKSKAPRLEPGWRKVFFDKIWTRMHKKLDADT